MTITLHQIFKSIAFKKLSSVDLPHYGSHQHEINGVSELREFFGTTEKLVIEVHWHFFEDNEESLNSAGSVTFYDARENHPTRTEWRLYYDSEGARILRHAEPGDELIFARTDDRVFALVFQENSEWSRAGEILFKFNKSDQDKQFELVDETTLQNQEISFLEQKILEALGIESTLPTILDDENLVYKEFGMEFPSTKEMSNFARTLVEVDLTEPDEALIRWLNREEELFRALEKLKVEQRLETQFETVDEFISYSLSVQNRRKSRMGFALENHLQALFDTYNLPYSREAKTEGNKKPDFLFPGIEYYQEPSFDHERLVMLGAKSSCKDRWRQVLTEANRISHKHLCTLEPGISINQTEEMKSSNLSLVIPESLHATYTAEQLSAVWSLEEFIKFVQATTQDLS